jgi:hypothetical protein
MNFTLTPVYTNTLTGANQNPVDPTNLSNGGFTDMQILNHVGEGTSILNFGEAVYIGSPALSADQYATLTIHNWVIGTGLSYFIYIRSDSGLGATGYAVQVSDNGDGTIEVTLQQVDTTTSLYDDLTAPAPVSGDSFTLIAVGPIIALYRNRSQLFEGFDATKATGSAFVSTGTPNALTDLTVVNMAFGNAAIAPPTTGLTLTPVYFNSLTGANQNPLDPTNLSAGGFSAFQVLNHVGSATVTNQFAIAFYVGTPALSNDQYCSVAIVDWVQGLDNNYFAIVRSDGAAGTNCYGLDVFDNDDGTCTIELDVVTGGNVTKTLYSNPGASLPTLGENFTLAAIGSRVGLWRNNTQLFGGTDTTFATGGAVCPFTTANRSST